jgi:hypothetical protein
MELHVHTWHKRLTPTMTLSAVSAPIQRSVPGTLLLITAGMTTIGIQHAEYLSRDSAISRHERNAYIRQRRGQE